ncbi:unnamed protein product [Cyprideis torosa]|uniref:Dihydroorotate dehydrogenase (quinone), mitochondrial n=1 Tax=Cyprideis torosa TaxID=163714 RepID=A0A7R8ZY08_9CRUS|nr:unnamed protein product [Cyprideis torosa]CAG0907648.1 unnamed protein product [Cyprideis torosa]
MTSRRPYLVRAMFEWISDNDLTPHIIVAANYPGRSINLTVPVGAVVGIYARENGQGMVFEEVDPDTDPTPDDQTDGEASDRAKKPSLRILEPEKAHAVSMVLLEALHAMHLDRLLFPVKHGKGLDLLGMRFDNKVGLAAGLDKNADHLDALGGLGFGFVEVGTVTPRPQPGNAKPRMFRLPEAQAIINRMGFNNEGVEHLIERVSQRQYSGVLGVNIGKNLSTSVEEALSDYSSALKSVYPHADYITVNISSPNTPGLRDLQHGDRLKSLLSGLKYEQMKMAMNTQRFVPLFVKVAPDLDQEQLTELATILVDEGVDGLVATNTTSSRDAVESLPHGSEAGGLSGRPLFAASTEVLRQYRELLPVDMPIIAAGGIFSASDAAAKIAAGANLVQLYSGFVYRGPALINECVEAIG